MFKQKFEDIYKNYKNVVEIYPVNNSTNKGIEDLMSGILKITLSSKFKRKLGVEEERPVNWLLLEDKAKALRATVCV